jgi:hypothetical protein
MEKPFYSCKDICEIYDISRSKAYQHIKKIKAIYHIDEDRLPRKGVVPSYMVKDHFSQGKKKKGTLPPTKAQSA